MPIPSRPPPTGSVDTPLILQTTAPPGRPMWYRVYDVDGDTADEGEVPETEPRVYRVVTSPALVETNDPLYPLAWEMREATDADSFDDATRIWGPYSTFWNPDGTAISEPSTGGSSGPVTLAPNQSFNNTGQTTAVPSAIRLVASSSGAGNVAPFNSDFTVNTDAYWRQTIGVTGLDSTGWTQFVLTVKVDPAADADAAALVAVRVTNPASSSDGLLVSKGAAATDRTLGTLVVDAITPATQVTWTLQAAAMDLPATAQAPYAWELTRWTGAVKEIVGAGKIRVIRSARRAVAAP